MSEIHTMETEWDDYREAVMDPTPQLAEFVPMVHDAFRGGFTAALHLLSLGHSHGALLQQLMALRRGPPS